jgi:DNA-directed RNA polymerase specialized sigma24 family protein
MSAIRDLDLGGRIAKQSGGSNVTNFASDEKILVPLERERSDSSDPSRDDLLIKDEGRLGGTQHEPPSPAVDKKLIKQEKHLVDRCVRGEVAAWEELYEKHHPALMRSIAVLLGTKGSDRNLVDELAAQVWYSLVDADGELLGRFCPKRGARLNTFIRAVAKDVTSRYFRTEQRRREREVVAARAASVRRDNDENPDDSLSEFLGTLSDSEREFTEAYLLSAYADDDGVSDRSETSVWQFTRRIRVKLGKFFGT